MFNYISENEFLSKSECEELLNYSIQNLSLERAKIVDLDDTKEQTVRKSSVSFNDYSKTFPNIVDKIRKKLNENIKIKGREFDFEINFQFTKYEKGEFYHWHTDSSPNSKFSERFCSFVIQLNEDYKGGELELREEDQSVHIFQKGVGNLSVFPSEKWHRVATVEEGTRYSLVGWYRTKPMENYVKTLL